MRVVADGVGARIGVDRGRVVAIELEAPNAPSPETAVPDERLGAALRRMGAWDGARADEAPPPARARAGGRLGGFGSARATRPR